MNDHRTQRRVPACSTRLLVRMTLAGLHHPDRLVVETFPPPQALISQHCVSTAVNTVIHIRVPKTNILVPGNNYRVILGNICI